MSEKDIGEPVKSMLKREYKRGYQQAENDYYNQSEKDRQSSYDCGYQQGRTDAIDELLNNISESIIWDILAEVMKRNIGASDGADKIIDYLQKVAEQLKEQKE